MEEVVKNLKKTEKLIDGVVLHKLYFHGDPRGLLVETLKNTWDDVYSETLPFTQSYCSITNPGVARDEDQWHNHPTKQYDRFVFVKGRAVTAIYDWRKESKTYGTLNLFVMGDTKEEEQYLLVIPKNVLHGFCAIGTEPAILMASPSHLYDKDEEGRVPFADVHATIPDGTEFSWDIVRKHFK